MNDNLPAIEPVTDEDYRAFTAVAFYPISLGVAAAIEQDRRRVAERQAPEIEHLRAEVARIEGLRVAAMEHLADYDVTVGKLQAEVATLRAERNTALRQLATHIDRSADDETVLRAEVARLSAACAVKDAALRMLDTYFNEQGNAPLDSNLIYAALSTDAGKGWIDATGAVEAQASAPSKEGPWLPLVWVPTDWAGKRVLIMLKPEAP